MSSGHGNRGNPVGTGKAVDILRRDPCAYCGEYERYPEGHKKAGKLHATIDHIHPRSRGGKDGWGNYTAACVSCNTRKGHNSLLGYLLGIQLESQDATALDTIVGNEGHWYDPFNLMTRRRDLRKRAKAVII